jgi:hypothetical protein
MLWATVQTHWYWTLIMPVTFNFFVTDLKGPLQMLRDLFEVFT